MFMLAQDHLSFIHPFGLHFLERGWMFVIGHLENWGLLGTAEVPVSVAVSPHLSWKIVSGVGLVSCPLKRLQE